MGNSTSSKARLSVLGPLLFETQKFAAWTVDDVRKLHCSCKNYVHGFALVEPQFECVMAFKKHAMGDVRLEIIFKALDNDNDGRIDGLEFLGGLALICQGTLEEKARLLFELFDFNLGADLSKNELIMMMLSTICGMICLTGGGEELEPSIQEIETLAEEAFQIADNDKSQSITYLEFTAWARGNREVISLLDSVAKINEQASLLEETEDSAEEGTDVEDEGLKAEGIGNKTIEAGVVAPSSGDQAMATKAFVGAIFEPTYYHPNPNSAKLPDSSLSIEWVHGYRGFDSRNNLRYLSFMRSSSSMQQGQAKQAMESPSSPSISRTIVYPTAALGVVYDVEHNTQRYYHGHSDDVISCSLHPNGRYVASGQIGKRPSIHVWDSSGMQCLSTICGFHQRGISHLLFSEDDGSLLVSVGLDDDHSIAIHQWEKAKLVASGNVNKNKVLGVAASPNCQNIAVVGVKFVKIFSIEGRALSARSGVIGSLGKIQAFCCVAFIGDTKKGEDIVVGTSSGHLYLFRNKQLCQTVQAHGVNEPVLSMYYSTEMKQLTTGGRDGVVMTFDSDLKAVGAPVDVIDLAISKTADSVMTSDTAIVSVHLSPGYILVGTRGGQIIELEVETKASNGQAFKARVLVNSHALGELWGCACHPIKAEFATVGEDKTIRTWSLRRLCQQAVRALPYPARAVTYSLCGKHIAVGMNSGAIAILEEGLEVVIDSFQHSKAMVSDVKYSPNSSTLAVASHDRNIYLYSVDILARKYSRRAVCSGHSAAILHIDFSVDSNFLQSTSADLELLFWQSSGNMYRSASKLRDVHWATWTSTLGWPCQGIWPSQAHGNDINAVDRDLKLGVLATADDEGNIKVFRYPCTEKRAMYQRYRGHSSHVCCVRFTADHRYLISTGGNDKTIIQWAHKVEELDNDSSDDETHHAKITTSSDVVCVDRSAVQRTPLQDAINRSKTSTELEELLKNGSSNTTGGDEMMATKPWMGAMVPPSKPLAIIAQHQGDSSTNVDLKLDWVFGYRSKDCRNNVKYTAGGDIVYNAAALGIIYHKNRHVQSFFQGKHTDDVISIALHPSGKIVATGEIGRKPLIIVWDVETKEVLASLEGFFQYGVSLLTFDKTGERLAGVGLDNDHSIGLYEWRTKRLIASGSSDKDKVFAISFCQPSPTGSSAVDRNNQPAGLPAQAPVEMFVTCGQNHIKFWKIEGKSFSCQKGIYGGKVERDSMMVVIALQQFTITGSLDGSVFLWQGHRLSHVVKGGSNIRCGISHHCAVHAMSPVDQTRAVTGDKNGVIILWQIDMLGSIESRLSNSNNVTDNIKLPTAAQLSAGKEAFGLEAMFRWDISEIRGPERPLDVAVRSVCLQQGNILLGTASSDILEAKVKASPAVAEWEWKSIMKGHSKGEAWALACHPHLDLVATGGDDGVLSIWDVSKRKQLCCSRRKDKVRALTYRPDGLHIAVALFDDTIEVLAAEKDGRLTMSSTKQSGAEDQNVFVVVAKLTQPIRWVEAIKYSFDSSFLAVGAHDRVIYIYDASSNGNYALLNKLQRHSSYITDIDFGVRPRDEKEYTSPYVTDKGMLRDAANPSKKERPIEKTELCMQTTCGAYELLFWSCANSSGNKKDDGPPPSSASYKWLPEPSATKMRDTYWYSWSCTLGWPVQGIYPPASDGTDVNACARSHTYRKVPVLATADDFGRISLFPYPCTKKAVAKVYRGHSSHVTNLGFTHDDGYLASIGGSDLCLFLWKTDCIEEARELELALSRETDTIPKELEEGKGHDQEKDATSPADIILHEEELGKSEEFQVNKDENRAGGDEFMAVKPYIGAIREPSTWKDGMVDADVPRGDMELTNIYGYRSQDVRNNLLYTSSTSEFVYHAAAVGIVFDSVQQKQRYNLSQTDDIISLSYHPRGLVATGELGRMPSIVVWDSNSGNTLKTVKGFHRRGVSLLSFSPSGRYLASIGLDDDHSMAIYNLEKDTLVAKEKVERSKCFGIAFGGVEDGEVVVVGLGFIKFFSFNDKTGELKSKKGILKKAEEAVLSVTFLSSDVVTGHGDGAITSWKGRTQNLRKESVHQKAVNSLSTWRGGTSAAAFLSGGADGLVVLWSAAIEPVKKFDLTQLNKTPLNAEIRSVSALQNFILVGTKSSEIIEIDVSTGESEFHLRGHFDGELWGLAAHPVVSNVATVGDEGTVRVFDLQAKSLLYMRDLKSKARALSYSPSGTQLSVALFSGELVVLTETLDAIIAQTNICKNWVQVMKYSPDGATLAIGSHDGNIYLFNAINYSRRAVCRGHHASITHVDFSSDSAYLQSNCQAYELLFWDVKTGNQIKSATSVRDVKWATYTLTCAWGSQGIWPSAADGTDCNSVDRSKSCGKEEVLVTADDQGKVKIFKYPCVQKGAKSKQYGGHSSHVTSVAFSKDDRFVLSTGGLDRCLMQWKYNPHGLK